MQVRVETHAAGLRFTVYGPSGSKVRGFYVGSGDESVEFVVEATGSHHVEIASPIENPAEVDYTVTLLKVVALADRLAATPATYESPRIKSLRAAIESGRRESVADFWEKVKKEGTPLIEPLESTTRKTWSLSFAKESRARTTFSCYGGPTRASRQTIIECSAWARQTYGTKR